MNITKQLATVAGLALLANVAAAAGHADVVPFNIRSTPVDPATVEGFEHCEAVIEVEDRVGVYNQADPIELDGIGTIVVQYTTHGGQTDPDEYAVLNFPPGYSVIPVDGVFDGVTILHICVMPAVGM